MLATNSLLQKFEKKNIVWDPSIDLSKVFEFIRVIHKVPRLGNENDQFRQHNRASNAYRGTKILQSEITGTQTSFPNKFGDKSEFHPVFLFS